MMHGISVRELLDKYERRLALQLIAGKQGLDRRLVNDEIHRPGLALAGFVDLYTYDRLQLLGNTEILFLNNLSHDQREAALDTIYQFELPCVVLTSGNDPPPGMKERAETRGIPLLVTRFATTKFVHLFGFYLDDFFAPQTTVHGSLVDVYGVGLLFTGESGIGKSEIALDLVERGHRLVADDIVRIIRRARGTLIGMNNEVIQHYVEIRGIGLVDVRRMFGIRGIRLQKRVEVEVHLVQWGEVEEYERIGLEDQVTSILDVEVPVVTVPIYPGKNLTVISEVIALNHLLRLYGHHPAKEFNKRLIDIMQQKSSKTRDDEV